MKHLQVKITSVLLRAYRKQFYEELFSIVSGRNSS